MFKQNFFSVMSVVSLATLSLVAKAQTTGKPATLKVKVAFIDVERCMNETEDGLRAKSSYRKLAERRQGSVYTLEQKLAEKQESIAKLQKSVSSPTDKSFIEAAINFEKERMDYMSAVKAVNDELALKRDEIERPIRAKLEQILTRIGQSEKYDLVIDRKAVARGPSDLDLTERVIREYNWGNKP